MSKITHVTQNEELNWGCLVTCRVVRHPSMEKLMLLHFLNHLNEFLICHLEGKMESFQKVGILCCRRHHILRIPRAIVRGHWYVLASGIMIVNDVSFD
jgi:hypothetical protein